MPRNQHLFKMKATARSHFRPSKMADSGAGPSKTTTKKDTYTYGTRELDAVAYCEILKGAKAKKNAVWWSSFNVLLLDGIVKLKCRNVRAQLVAVGEPLHQGPQPAGQERAEKLIYVRQNSRVLQKGRGGAHDEEVMMKLIEGLEVQE